MRTPVLILPVKGQIFRTRGGKKWQNVAEVLCVWHLTRVDSFKNLLNFKEDEFGRISKEQSMFLAGFEFHFTIFPVNYPLSL